MAKTTQPARGAGAKRRPPTRPAGASPRRFHSLPRPRDGPPFQIHSVRTTQPAPRSGGGQTLLPKRSTEDRGQRAGRSRWAPARPPTGPATPRADPLAPLRAHPARWRPRRRGIVRSARRRRAGGRIRGGSRAPPAGPRSRGCGGRATPALSLRGHVREWRRRALGRSTFGRPPPRHADRERHVLGLHHDEVARPGARELAAPLRRNLDEEEASLGTLTRFAKDGTLSPPQPTPTQAV